MRLAFYILYLWFTSNRMAAIFDFARQKCKPYGSVDLWAKFGAFGRIWTKQSFYCPNTPTWQECQANTDSIKPYIQALQDTEASREHGKKGTQTV